MRKIRRRKIKHFNKLASSYDSFMSELVRPEYNADLTMVDGRIGWKIKFSPNCSVKFVLLEHEENSIYLSTIETTPDEECRGMGYGSLVMNLIANIADKYNSTIHLIASSFGDKKVEERLLREWYSKFGFEDFDRSQRMVRYPKGSSNDTGSDYDSDDKIDRF